MYIKLATHHGNELGNDGDQEPNQTLEKQILAGRKRYGKRETRNDDSSPVYIRNVHNSTRCARGSLGEASQTT